MDGEEKEEGGSLRSTTRREGGRTSSRFGLFLFISFPKKFARENREMARSNPDEEIRACPSIVLKVGEEVEMAELKTKSRTRLLNSVLGRAQFRTSLEDLVPVLSCQNEQDEILERGRSRETKFESLAFLLFSPLAERRVRTICLTRSMRQMEKSYFHRRDLRSQMFPRSSSKTCGTKDATTRRTDRSLLPHYETISHPLDFDPKRLRSPALKGEFYPVHKPKT